jgi:hypothetical protein
MHTPAPLHAFLVNIRALFHSSLRFIHYRLAALKQLLDRIFDKKTAPFLLTAALLSILLAGTLAFAASSEKPNAAPHRTRTLPVPRADSASTERLFFDSDRLSFAYPPSWSLDTLAASASGSSWKLIAKDTIVPSSIDIEVSPYPDGERPLDLAEYLVRRVETGDSLDRFFLRNPSHFTLSGTQVVQIPYSVVTVNEVSIRGLKMAFFIEDRELVTVSLSTRYPNSLGNNVQVDQLRPLCYDLILSMLNKTRN